MMFHFFLLLETPREGRVYLSDERVECTIGKNNYKAIKKGLQMKWDFRRESHQNSDDWSGQPFNRNVFLMAKPSLPA
jgi:hypothetical protein